jgi:thiamine-phosphate pyrophosphorylase
VGGLQLGQILTRVGNLRAQRGELLFDFRPRSFSRGRRLLSRGRDRLSPLFGFGDQALRPRLGVLNRGVRFARALSQKLKAFMEQTRRFGRAANRLARSRHGPIVSSRQPGPNEYPCLPHGMPAWNADRLRATLRLYLLADAGLVPVDRLAPIVAAALRGGVTAVQLRAKTATTLELLELARAVGAVCADAGVPFIVNDRVDVALAAGADGAHVGHIGEEDLSPHDARRLLGPDAIVGVSVGTGPEAHLATSQGASYVSAGPMFATSTKANAGPAAGEQLLRSVRAATPLPMVVIGGITPERAAALFAAGADGVCVGAAIIRAADPEAAARKFFELGGAAR